MTYRNSVLTLCCLAIAGCNPLAPALLDWEYRPPSASEVPRLEGVWRGTDTISAVHQGDCLGLAMQSQLGTVSALQLEIQQSGINLSGTITRPEDGTVCPIVGSFWASTMVDLKTVTGACNVKPVGGFICSNGEARDLEHVWEMITPDLSNGIQENVMTGTRTVLYAVFRSRASSGWPMYVKSQVRLRRQ